MLSHLSAFEGFAFRAEDGDIGHLRDVYFDDQDWQVRYLVVDTGSWLTGRRVLIAPQAVIGQLWSNQIIPVALTRAQIENSPSIDTAKPVERQHEIELHTYYGWPPYWGLLAPDLPITPLDQPAALDAPSGAANAPDARPVADPHLHSAKKVAGYHIAAVDGLIGHVVDYLIDTDRWRIRYLVIDTRNWWPGRKVLIAPDWIRSLNWNEASVVVDLTRARIRGGPTYDPATRLTVEMTDELHDHHGRPRHRDHAAPPRTPAPPDLHT